MTDQQYLARASEIAKNSTESIGCGVVIVCNGAVIAEEYNSQRADNIAVNHCEIKAIIVANKKLGSRELSGCVAYCSCEPCVMCLTAFSYAKISRVVFDKTMKDVFPEDPQSQMDPFSFVKQLNFVPRLEHLRLA